MRIRLLYSLLIIPFISAAQNTNTLFNITAPNEQPALFAPGLVSDEFGNRDMAISPSGSELFYTLQYLSGRGLSTIMYSKKVNGKWSKPEVAPFCGKYSDLEPAFSPDGKRLYFVSNRSLDDTLLKSKDFDIWFVEKINGVWVNPKNMGEPVNTKKDEFYPSVTKSGNIYFTRNMGEPDEDIVVCKFQNNKYDTAISLPGTVNSNGGEFNAFVDADEQFVIFTGYRRKGNFGSGDLFISYNKDGGWTEAKNLGDIVNGAGLTYCPYVSPDKKYFFFTTSRGYFKPLFSKRQTMRDLEKLMHSPLNGWDNIYWMDAGTIFKK
jgi:hypothetical protein